MELNEWKGVYGKADSVWIERTKQLRAEVEKVQVRVHSCVSILCPACCACCRCQFKL